MQQRFSPGLQIGVEVQVGYYGGVWAKFSTVWKMFSNLPQKICCISNTTNFFRTAIDKIITKKCCLDVSAFWRTGSSFRAPVCKTGSVVQFNFFYSNVWSFAFLMSFATAAALIKTIGLFLSSFCKCQKLFKFCGGESHKSQLSLFQKYIFTLRFANQLFSCFPKLIQHRVLHVDKYIKSILEFSLLRFLTG